MRNHSNENEFDLHENGHVGETHFHMNSFARRLVLKQRQRVTRKWPIFLAKIKTTYRIFSIKRRVSNKRRVSRMESKIGPSGIYLRYNKLQVY